MKLLLNKWDIWISSIPSKQYLVTFKLLKMYGKGISSKMNKNIIIKLRN